MIRRILALAALTVAWAAPTAAQSLGTFRFQLQPYCNVVAVTIVQQGAQYQLDGTDDQCGTGPRAAVSGLAFPNPSGLLGFGFTIVTAPGGTPVHVDADLNLGTLSGSWRDSAGNTGTFPLLFGPGTGGSPRPSPAIGDITGVTAGAGLSGGAVSGAVTLAVDFATTQQRVTGTCPSGQLMTAVQQNGSVTCQSVTGAGGGDITGVNAGVGLIGGATTGEATLAVSFDGPGSATSAARSDHTHLRATGTRNVAIGPTSLPINANADNVAVGNAAMAASTTGFGNVALGNFSLRFGTGASFNTAVGHVALQATTGNGNTAVGYFAGQANTAGADNVAVGLNALRANTTANFNTALGAGSLQSNTTGTNNVAVGRLALASNVGDNDNTAVGVGALSTSTAGGNTALGYQALGSNTTGASNVAVGIGALQFNTTANGNTAVGTEALQNSTTGAGNTALGANALGAATTASSNTAVGNDALGSATTGADNTAIGRNALGDLIDGTSNVAIGRGALAGNISGESNVAIGVNAGAGGTGFNNVYLGTDVAGVTTQSNTIRIGNTAHVATFIRGISGATSSGGVAVFVNANGQLGTLTSSRRFKDDIASLGETFSARVQALRPVSFTYKPAFDDGAKQAQYGLVAEEVAEIFPELVVRNADGSIQTVRYHFLAPLLLAEVQRLERERAWADTERTRLEDRVRKLEETLSTLAIQRR